jgi:tetratricopeptide (TPR) repeat protein
MANIALREYHRKIERLIENHQIEEAFSHCANILRKFPKEIETYRKLGKNFLEKQDIDLSERVFNIILSVFPDDFVANVGLSFIHENKGEMDQAIDHMLMAFELQPANPSLQDELKRLYHKRDSVEPNKIRLTRGALIKMYARSNLFEQAIAEIKLGLYEKPNRIDFKLILADMLWKAGSRIEAVETCVDIVSQLPYCWKANEILDLAFQDLHHEQADSNYRLRLAELDPYYRFMLPATQSVADIPDIAVQMDSDLDEENGINEWGNFLSDTWVVSSLPAVEEASDDDLDWNAILDEAGQEQESAREQSSAGIALFEELTRDRDNELLTLNRRQSFIDRLQKRGREPKFEGTNESGESNAETGLSSEVQSLPEAISPQSNVQSAPVQEGNTPEEFDTFASGAETDPHREPPLDTGAAPGFAEDKNGAAEIAEPRWLIRSPKPALLKPRAAGEDLTHDLEFPAAEGRMRADRS